MLLMHLQMNYLKAILPVSVYCINGLDGDLLQNIAFENNLAETAFIVKNNSQYDLRWFTPETEIDLCGPCNFSKCICNNKFY